MYENERQTDSEESFMEHTEHMDGHQKLLVSCWQVFTDMKKKYQKKLVNNMNLSWTQQPSSINNKTTKLYSHFWSLRGMCVRTQRRDFWDKIVSHLTDKNMKRSLPAHCLPE